MRKYKVFFLCIVYCLSIEAISALEISTLTPKHTTNVEAAIEYTNSLRDIRQKTYTTLRNRYIQSPTPLRNITRTAYNIVDSIIFGIGSGVSVHEVGHTNAFEYLGASKTTIGTGSNNDASLLEVYVLSPFNQGAFATAEGLGTTSAMQDALIAGSGINAGWNFKNKIVLNSLQKESLSFTEHNDLGGVHLASLIYVFQSPESDDNNDFNAYINAIKDQKYTLSIENLRTQFLISSLLSYSFTSIYIDNSRVKTTSFKSIFLGTYQIYYPEFTAYLMPSSVTEHIELFFRKKDLFSIAYEFPTFGNKSQTELTIGWYPKYKNITLQSRLTYTNKHHTYLNLQTQFKLNESVSIFTKAFIGNLHTYAQTREALSDRSTYSVGLKYTY